jgi:hypothetical protein
VEVGSLDRVVAVKLERADTRHPQLRYESRVLAWLNASLDSASVGLPRCLWSGPAGPLHQALVMQRLGPSLEEVFERRGRRFSLTTVCRIGVELLDRLRAVHTRRFLHRVRLRTCARAATCAGV